MNTLFDIKCFHNFSSFEKEAKKYKSYESLLNRKYKKTVKRQPFGKFNILKNVLNVNIKQCERLLAKEKTDLFKWPNIIDDNDNGYSNLCEGNFYLDDKISFFISRIGFNNRSLVLYFRDGTFSDYIEDGKECYGVDHYLFLAIYYFVKRLIKEKKSCLFNNVKVISHNNNIPDYFYNVFPDIKLETGWSSKFIVSSSLFSNSIHFFGNQLPDNYFYTIPLLCDAFRHHQYIEQIKNKIFLPFWSYPGYIENNKVIPNDIDFVQGVTKTYKDISKLNLKEENVTVENIFEHLYNGIIKLENKLIKDEICEW